MEAKIFPLEHGTIPDLLPKRTFQNIFVLLRMERSKRSEFQRIKAVHVKEKCGLENIVNHD